MSYATLEQYRRAEWYRHGATSGSKSALYLYRARRVGCDREYLAGVIARLFGVDLSEVEQ